MISRISFEFGNFFNEASMSFRFQISFTIFCPAVMCLFVCGDELFCTPPPLLSLDISYFSVSTGSSQLKSFSYCIFGTFVYIHTEK